MPVPAGLNWELFQGPAPRKPYKTGRQRQWRYYWDYGGGLVTDWGVHLADTALWFMDAQLKAPKLTTGVGQFVNVQNPDRDRPFNAFTASWQYDKFVMTFSNAVIGNPDFPFQGTVFIGPRGSLVVNRTGYMLRPPKRGLGGGRGRSARVPVAPRPSGAARRHRRHPPLEAQDGHGRTGAGDGRDGHDPSRQELPRLREVAISSRCRTSRVGFYATLPCVLAIRAMREGTGVRVGRGYDERESPVSPFPTWCDDQENPHHDNVLTFGRAARRLASRLALVVGAAAIGTLQSPSQSTPAARHDACTDPRWPRFAARRSRVGEDGTRSRICSTTG